MSVSKQQMANAIRALSMDAVEAAKSGHPGMPMGMADAATALFCDHLKFDAAQPHWPDRDRFILSAGHGSMLIYAYLYLTGYQDMTLDEIKNFRQWGAKTAGHPEYGHATGIETTTGPLGQGIANAVGMAMAERHKAASFGSDLVDHYTYVIAGDGCLMEGVSHEAASLAGHLKLGRIIVLFDDNGISIDGPTSLTVSEDTTKRYEAYGWQVLSCDGHDASAVSAAISQAKDDERPTLIRCKTTIGYGAPTKKGTSGIHGAPLGADEIAGTRQELDWPHAPFEVPEDILSAWRSVGAKGASDFAAWQDRLNKADNKQAFEAMLSGQFDKDVNEAIAAYKVKLAQEPQKVATRVASQKAIEALLPSVPAMFGGSADLTGSNNTRVGDHDIFNATNHKGTYVHYGVREHGMAAAMNGIALHGGLVPFGGTFLVFTDYCRPSIRLSALMEQRVIYVMTHDSIGLGEDGPTHQPVEHIASLRAMPNVNVFRPADIVETAEAWQIAMTSHKTPSVLALSRQGLPQLRLGADVAMNKSAKGGYVLTDASTKAKVTLLATGSEVAIADEARQALEADGIPTKLVSVPCLDILKQQDEAYINELLGENTVQIAIEAGISQGWSDLIGRKGTFIGMTGFGASAPAGTLYEEFGITAKAIVTAAKAKLS
ncbi:MAG: transketolase [Candidatus Puniceispirillaceae bacterium]